MQGAIWTLAKSPLSIEWWLRESFCVGPRRHLVKRGIFTIPGRFREYLPADYVQHKIKTID